MKLLHLLSLCTAMACSIATAHTYPRYTNATTQALEIEAQLMLSPDSIEKARRVSIGDNAENAAYWNGDKPLPAAQVADLLQLSLAAGSTGAEDWFTNAAGDVLVFVARPGVGAKHYVFTVFNLKNEEWYKTGTYHFITRHLHIRWQDAAIGNRGLTIVATSPNGTLRVEKHFDFAEPRDTFCAYDAPDEAPDMGLNTPEPAPTPQQSPEWAPRFIHYSSYGYPRYDNDVTRALEAEIALMNGKIHPKQGRRAFAAFIPDNIACWDGHQAIPAARVADLLQLSKKHGYSVADDWFTNASGSVIAFVAQPGNGAVSDVFTVFRRSGSVYRRVGVYTFTRRALNLCPNELELTEESLTLTYSTPNNNTRFTKTFSFRSAEDSCCAFEDVTERNDCGKDTRPNRYVGLPELAASPARERLQPSNEITRRLRRAEQLFFYSPASIANPEQLQGENPLMLLYLNKLRHGNVVDWISDAKSNTIAFISRSGVKHEVITTYTFHVYRTSDQGYKLIGTYNLLFSPYELKWDPAQTYFRHNGLHVRCSDLGGTRHTGAIFHYSQPTGNVQLN
ncbi:MAG: hypothetical protein IKZ13_09845 [Akkermansia sp.]|nr:hypothetical protein [Akkermansia sp.]